MDFGIFEKTKTVLRSGCNYARQSLLPAVWEEVRQREKSNDFLSVGYQWTVRHNLSTLLNDGFEVSSSRHLFHLALRLHNWNCSGFFPSEWLMLFLIVLPKWHVIPVHIMVLIYNINLGMSHVWIIFNRSVVKKQTTKKKKKEKTF